MTELECQPKTSDVPGCRKESAIVEQFCRGDDEAFEWIVRQYSSQIHALASRLLGWQGSAEDVVQDVFVAALANRKKFRAQSSLKTWLFKITINKCKTRRYRQMLTLKFLEKQQPSEPVHNPDKGAYEPVQKAVAALPEKYRQVIVLKYLNELPTWEILEILKISKSTFNTRLSRARSLLKGKLKNWK